MPSGCNDGTGRTVLLVLGASLIPSRRQASLPMKSGRQARKFLWWAYGIIWKVCYRRWTIINDVPACIACWKLSHLASFVHEQRSVYNVPWPRNAVLAVVRMSGPKTEYRSLSITAAIRSSTEALIFHVNGVFVNRNELDWYKLVFGLTSKNKRRIYRSASNVTGNAYERRYYTSLDERHLILENGV